MDKFLIKYCSLYKNWSCYDAKVWSRQRQKGVAHFIWEVGVLKWGLWACTTFILILHFRDELTFQSFTTACITWFLGSILYGYLYWLGTNLSFKNRQKSVSINHGNT